LILYNLIDLFEYIANFDYQRDGGKIGGVQSWLNPLHIPQNPIYCSDCPDSKKTKMRFLAQLYCPVDDDDEDEDDNQAFHRSLYVYVCPESCHSKPNSNGNENCGGVRVLRCQLPRSNPFYPYENDDAEDDDNRITTVTHLSTDGWDIHLCAVCGQRGKGKCPKQNLWFCSKECQKEHFQYIFSQKQTNKESSDNTASELPESNLISVPSLYNELELVVEEEPPPLSAISIDNTTNASTRSQKKLLKQIQKEAWFDDDNDDVAIEQSDLNAMTGTGMNGGGTSDKNTLNFFHRIDRVNCDTDKSVKDQCLRYQRWEYEDDDENEEEEEKVEKNDEVEGPLWISNLHVPTSKSDIPNCPYCGSERKFEFQIMPQMLNYLTSIYKASNCENEINDVTASNDQSSAHGKSKKSSLSIPESSKQAIMAISDIRDREGDENIGQEYIQKHDEALAKVKDELLGNSDGSGGGKDSSHSLDFGVISVFTCTKSCGIFVEGDVDSNNELGTYREEFAWRQPPLD